MIPVRVWFEKSVGQERISRLREWQDFDSILRRLLEESDFYFCGWEVFLDRRLAGCKRITFGLKVSTDIYDAFFNAPEGYRGQYAKEVREGSEANRKTIEKFSPRALKFAATHQVGTPADIESSLSACQAKIWILESEVKSQFVEEPAIKWKRWKDAVGSGFGLRAPVGERLEIKGGWIDKFAISHLDEMKGRRDDEINSTGFT